MSDRPAPHQPGPNRRRYATLDAWRGAACLAVVLFHSFGGVSHDPLPAFLEPVHRIADHGWLGLHAFFVLSGYCIFERIRVALRTGESAGEFLLDRARRIFPPYWVALLATIAMNLIASPLNGTTFVGNLPPTAWSWLSNITLTHALFGQGGYILVTWTLTCECAFYLISAVLLRLAAGTKNLDVAFGAGALLCLVPLVLPFLNWTLPLQLWPDFFAGIVISVALGERRWTAFAILAALTVMAFVSSRSTLSHRFAAIFAWVLIGLYSVDGWTSGLVGVRILSWVGMFSYSLYLIHVPLVSRVVNLSRRFIETSSAGFVGVWLMALLVSIAGGWLFWRVVENRVERWRTKLRQPYRRQVSAVISSSAASPLA